MIGLWGRDRDEEGIYLEVEASLQLMGSWVTCVSDDEFPAFCYLNTESAKAFELASSIMHD